MSILPPRPYWHVVFYTTPSGRSPVLEYVNALSVLEQVEVRNAVRLLEEYGIKLGMPEARHVQGKLWELRPTAHRLLYFAHVEHTFVILHAFHKQTNKTPKQDLELALRRMGEYL
jgi:phage-related protein